MHIPEPVLIETGIPETGVVRAAQGAKLSIEYQPLNQLRQPVQSMALIEQVVQPFAEQVGRVAASACLGIMVCLRYCKEMKAHATKTGNISPGKNTTYINTINELE